MTGAALREIYVAHAGKVSQKWSLYLDVYERVLAHRREDALRLVEIGVENGGSLEIWAKYFPEATAIVGCDVDERCAALRFEDPRIGVVVGAVNARETARALLALANPIDVFVDDGSHRSPDVILAFMNYFPFVRPASIAFHDSLCVIEKRPADGSGRRGELLASGREAGVRPEVLSLGKRTVL